MICIAEVCHGCVALEEYLETHPGHVGVCGTCGRIMNMRVIVVTRHMCLGCSQAKELLESYGVECHEVDAQSDVGMAELAMCGIGPETLLPCIICDCYANLEALELIFHDSGIPVTLTVRKR